MLARMHFDTEVNGTLLGKPAVAPYGENEYEVRSTGGDRGGQSQILLRKNWDSPLGTFGFPAFVGGVGFWGGVGVIFDGVV